MLDNVSIQILGLYGFWQRYVEHQAIFVLILHCYDHCMYNLEQVFSIFEDLCIYVDCVATREVGVSVSLDPSKI
jgi:hypothetical protein